MSTSIAELQRTIDTEKATLSRGLDALEDKARAMVDWRGPIRTRPLDAVGLALLGGGLIGLLVGGRRRPSSRAPQPEVTERSVSSAPARTHGVRTRLVEALTTFAMARAADVLQQVMPGRASTPDHANHNGQR